MVGLRFANPLKNQMGFSSLTSVMISGAIMLALVSFSMQSLSFTRSGAAVSGRKLGFQGFLNHITLAAQTKTPDQCGTLFRNAGAGTGKLTRRNQGLNVTEVVKQLVWDPPGPAAPITLVQENQIASGMKITKVELWADGVGTPDTPVAGQTQYDNVEVRITADLGKGSPVRTLTNRGNPLTLTIATDSTTNDILSCGVVGAPVQAFNQQAMCAQYGWQWDPGSNPPATGQCKLGGSSFQSLMELSADNNRLAAGRNLPNPKPSGGCGETHAPPASEIGVGIASLPQPNSAYPVIQRRAIASIGKNPLFTAQLANTTVQVINQTAGNFMCPGTSVARWVREDCYGRRTTVQCNELATSSGVRNGEKWELKWKIERKTCTGFGVGCTCDQGLLKGRERGAAGDEILCAVPEKIQLSQK